MVELMECARDHACLRVSAGVSRYTTTDLVEDDPRDGRQDFVAPHHLLRDNTEDVGCTGWRKRVEACMPHYRHKT